MILTIISGLSEGGDGPRPRPPTLAPKTSLDRDKSYDDFFSHSQIFRFSSLVSLDLSSVDKLTLSSLFLIHNRLLSAIVQPSKPSKARDGRRRVLLAYFGATYDSETLDAARLALSEIITSNSTGRASGYWPRDVTSFSRNDAPGRRKGVRRGWVVANQAGDGPNDKFGMDHGE